MTRFSDISRRDDVMSEVFGAEQEARLSVLRVPAFALTSGDCYEFAAFRLFPQQRTLLIGNERVGIGGRAFDLLFLLVSQAGNVVGANELIQQVWPNLTVDHSNLRVQIGLLRKTLSRCEEAKRAIETIALRGYCFVLPVRLRTHQIGPSHSGTDIGAPLPLLPSLMVGRDDAVRTIHAALKERRLVSITGPGGIGKTTVALATAQRCAETLGVALSFVDLSEVRDRTKAAHVIAERLRIAPSRSPQEDLCDYFRLRKSLLILDTCEHVVEPIALLAEALLSQCPCLTLLVTSQEALRATGEWTYRLRSLTFPEDGAPIEAADISRYSAIALFLDRVQSSTRFKPDEHELSIIAAICRRLDGIPLALEFAAGRVPDLGLRNTAAHLNNCFAILTRGRRTALPRHRTLIAAFDWSYGLLSDSEKRMLSYLAAIGGSFRAAQAVSSFPDRECKESWEAFYGLYDKSLLTLEVGGEEPIFRLLHTTRTYVLEKIRPSFVPSSDRGRGDLIQEHYAIECRALKDSAHA